MKENDSMFKRLSLSIVALLFVAFGLGLLFRSDMIAYGKGLAFGGVFSILKLRLMEISLKKSVTLPPEKAQAYGSFQYFIRYLLTGIVLVLSALEPSIDIIGTIIGLLALKGAAVLIGFVTKPTPKDGSVEFVEWEDDEEESSDF